MDINTYINTLKKDELDLFAKQAGTSTAYIKQLASGHRKAGMKSISGIVSASNGVITPADLRPDAFGAAA